MKVLFYRVNIKKNKKKNTRHLKLNFERILFVAFIVTFLAMILVQGALTSPAIRTYLTVDSEFEGKPLGIEEYLYKDGEMRLELLNSDTDANANANVKVLVNGEEVAAFENKTVDFKVKDGDIVEIDGSNAPKSVDVKLVFKTDNISSVETDSRFTVNCDIKRIFKVKLDE